MNRAGSTNSSESEVYWRGFGCSRILIVAAHPDDEAIGCGAAIGGLKRRLPWVVFVTDGAPERAEHSQRQTYAELRRKEASAALARLRVESKRVHWLGFADQSTSFRMRELTLALNGTIDLLKPDVIITHAYEGGHPDHDATALAVHVATRSLVDRGLSAPMVIEFCSYHMAADGKGGEFGAGFLPMGSKVIKCALSVDEKRLKRELQEIYASQAEVLSQFPVEVESFRIAPSYNFRKAPHPGRLYYEMHDWGICGKEWRQLATRVFEADEFA